MKPKLPPSVDLRNELGPIEVRDQGDTNSSEGHTAAGAMGLFVNGKRIADVKVVHYTAHDEMFVNGMNVLGDLPRIGTTEGKIEVDDPIGAIQRLTELLAQHNQPILDEGCYAKEDENGVVWIYRADESPAAYMSRKNFDAFITGKKRDDPNSCVGGDLRTILTNEPTIAINQAKFAAAKTIISVEKVQGPPKNRRQRRQDAARARRKR